MLLKRIIPIILIRNGQCVKTYRYKRATYVGDPINIVKIFNEKEVDELIILDINAQQPNFKLLQTIVSEAFMPITYGGGIKGIKDARQLFSIGIEKISINSYAVKHPDIIKKLADIFGSASIVVSVDVKKNIWGKFKIYNNNMKNAVDWLKKCEALGAGELLVTNVEREGTLSGYDIDFFKTVSSIVNIPIIANGGASGLDDIKELFMHTQVSAAAAGTMFVFNGKHRAVLISYPSEEKEKLYENL